MNTMRKSDWFLLYVIVVIGITLLRISRGYPQEISQFMNNFVELTQNIIDYFGLTKLFYVLKEIPVKWLLLLADSIQMAIGFLILFLFRTTWEQGTMILLKKSTDVLKAGIYLYIMLFAAVAVFIYSVVGLPIGGILILLQHIAVSFGRIPIAIFLGYMLLQQFHINGEIYLYYMIGSFIMLLFENMYIIGGAFLFFIFPVFALGVDMLLLLYHFVYQCNIPVELGQQHTKFDRKKIRDIIKKDL